MSSLNKYIEQQQTQINESLEAIAQLQQQLTQLQQQVRVTQQLNQAQETAEREVTAWLKQGRKLLRDLCGVYPVAAIADLAEEVTAIASEVQAEYEQHAQSGRFLNGVEEEEDNAKSAKDMPLIVESLPSESDNETPLSTSQVEQLLQGCDEPRLSFLKQQTGIDGRVKKLPILAKRLSEQGMTHFRLRQLLQAAELSIGSLVLNGSKSPQS